MRLVVGLYVLSGLTLIALPSYGWILALVAWLYVVNYIDIIDIDDQTSAKANRPWRRFIWLNQIAGFVVTVILIYEKIIL